MVCNADAAKKDLKGHAHKAFMKDCLSAKQNVVKNTQQDKMKTCNADTKAKSLKGEERKTFMKTYLSGN